MVFNSLQFALFFSIFLAVLLILPKKLRKVWLLSGNVLFYFSWNRPACVLLLVSALLAWFCGFEAEKHRRNRVFILIQVLWAVGWLFFFKFIGPANMILRRAGAGGLISLRDLIVPVGISFYMLRCIGYTADAAHGKISARKNPLDVVIYVSFFPQIISGPLERPSHFFADLRSFSEKDLFCAERIRNGFLLIFWGLFQKLVLSERLAVMVTSLYSNFESRGFWELLAASVAYTLQIYCDFSGYSDMSRGIAGMLGFSSMRNFSQPYFASDIKAFWRRWHISLTSWLTDHIYIPLGGSRKGIPRKYVNIIIVFLISGLWHGSTLNFVFWGLLHAFYQIMQDLWQRTGRHLPRLLSGTITLAAVNFAWIFFNSGGLNRGIRIVRRMFTHYSFPASFETGMIPGNLIVLIIGLVILFIVDLLHEKGISVNKGIASLPLPLRWLIFLGLLWAVIMLGIYGVGYDTSSFIYAQF